jgi:hypothetical protein
VDGAIEEFIVQMGTSAAALPSMTRVAEWQNWISSKLDSKYATPYYRRLELGEVKRLIAEIPVEEE